MKIKQEHYQEMERIINEFMASQANSLDTIHKNYQAQGLSDKRFIWDCFYASKLPRFACDNLYSYMNDCHIESALKSIILKRC